MPTPTLCNHNAPLVGAEPRATAVTCLSTHLSLLICSVGAVGGACLGFLFTDGLLAAALAMVPAPLGIIALALCGAVTGGALGGLAGSLLDRSVEYDRDAEFVEGESRSDDISPVKY